MSENTWKRGRKLTCECGTCKTCRRRAYFRLKNEEPTRKARIAAAKKAYYARTKPRWQQYQREHHLSYKAVGRKGELAAMRIYGISSEEYRALIDRNRCDICATDKPGHKNGWTIDHDHATKKVRGLLCHNCNCHLVPLIERYSHLFEKIRAYLADPPGALPALKLVRESA